MRRADLVNKHLRIRAAIHEHARCAGVIQVNVRQQNRAHIVELKSSRAQRMLQRRERRRRPGIEDRDAAGSVQKRRCDDARLSEKFEVDKIESGRKRFHFPASLKTTPPFITNVM